MCNPLYERWGRYSDVHLPNWPVNPHHWSHLYRKTKIYHYIYCIYHIKKLLRFIFYWSVSKQYFSGFIREKTHKTWKMVKTKSLVWQMYISLNGLSLLKSSPQLHAWLFYGTIWVSQTVDQTVHSLGWVCHVLSTKQHSSKHQVNCPIILCPVCCFDWYQSITKSHQPQWESASAQLE